MISNWCAAASPRDLRVLDPTRISSKRFARHAPREWKADRGAWRSRRSDTAISAAPIDDLVPET
jgi:hypothetical protein